MCGIVGSFPTPELEWVSQGLVKIAHRGPDARSLMEIPKGTLGHSRLAILDVLSGHQPMASQDRWIILNGEIYNYLELRNMLPGHFSTDSDTEVVLKLYETYGPRCVSMLDGMFAFAVLDKTHLFLARDPLGIKPLYYATRDGQMYFASEIKALMSTTADVQEFPPGCWWHSSHGFQKYYQIGKPQCLATDVLLCPQEEDLSVIKQTMRDAVHKRLIADVSVPVGVSLSGGLDSSIVASLAREAKETLDTFVVGTSEGEDIGASQQVANHLDTRHHRYVYTFDEMLKALPEVIYHLESFDAPLVRSAIPNYFLARLASDHVKVMLTGEGADELFAGYEYLEPITDPEMLNDELWVITARLHNTNLQRTDRMTMAHGLEGRVPFLDTQMVEMAFDLPAHWKLQEPDWPEKELLRRTFSDMLPETIVRRPKQKFSDGAGSINLLAQYAEETIADAEFARERELTERVILRSKEELLYYHIFRDVFGDDLSPEIVGTTRSITRDELH